MPPSQDVLLTRPLGHHPVGTHLTVSPARASALVSSGLARYTNDETSASAQPTQNVASTDEPAAPPRTGKGSGRDAWAAYASDVLEIDITDDDSRADIIAKVDADTP